MRYECFINFSNEDKIKITIRRMTGLAPDKILSIVDGNVLYIVSEEIKSIPFKDLYDYNK